MGYFILSTLLFGICKLRLINLLLSFHQVVIKYNKTNNGNDKMINKIKISVRNLVEFVMRSGDIDNTFRSMNSAVEGTKAHGKVQKSYGAGYRSEVTLRHRVEYEEFTIEVQGRADGILEDRGGATIDEIKSTTRDLDEIDEGFNPLHWAQAKCYGYIYCVDSNLDEISIQITYFHIETEEKKIIKKKFTLRELEDYFYNLIEKYIEWSKISFYWREKRDSSIGGLNFPFEDYRRGQRELAVAAYKTILEGKKLYASAPTGIGKTMSTLFPSIKAVGEKKAEKIFYLTAKTITREVPIASMRLLEEKGLKAKTVVITAKDKICLNDERKCNPRDCSYAKGHFDRVNEAIIDIFENENLITREVAIEYAEKYHVCPFEFVLDVSLWADVIVADYNYVFDPQVYLKRFFEGISEDYVFLVDEAHNLVDRSREMFSAQISTESFENILDIFDKKYKKLKRSIIKCKDLMKFVKGGLSGKKEYYSKEEITELYYPFKRSITLLEPWLIEEKKEKRYEEVLELYFGLLTYIKISDLYDNHYVTYIKEEGDNTIYKLYCVDSSYLLREAFERGKSSILFSATLNPIDYYMNLLGENKGDYNIRLTSPFPSENLCLLIDSTISTKYRDREYTYIDVVKRVESFVKVKRGNYLVFFPSHKYMNTIYDLISKRNCDLNIIMQETKMDEVEREAFLQTFNEENDLIAFAVMGGIFSEGIDLVGKKLIGAVIVGVGMPMISFERNIIRDYFDSTGEDGFEYAYTYPGMNKVLQGSGRVIRSKRDKGAVLLIDSRYRTKKYKSLFPREWRNYNMINSGNLMKRLKEFW